MSTHRNVRRQVLVLGCALLLSCVKEGAPTPEVGARVVQRASSPVVVAAAASGVAPKAVLPAWTTTAPMATARGQHTAVLLGSGKVLVLNGVNRLGFVDAADVYDPETGTWSSVGTTGLTGNISQSLLLPDGRVLLLADGSPTGRIYDPATNTWTSTGPMATTRSIPTLTLLRAGRVLVAGGTNSVGSRLTTAELYDPGTNTFLPTGAMSMARGAHTAALLRDGRVLAVSGFNASGEVPGADIYDPATGTWSAAAPPLVPRHYATSTSLPDGRVLLAGGFGVAGALGDAELYDPTSNTWTATGSLARVRSGHTATLLTNGRVLVAGGAPFNAAPQTVAESFDPATGTWSDVGTLAIGRENHTATLLPSGKVFITGGFDTTGGTTFYAETELYDPAINSWRPAGTLSVAAEGPLSALLSTGQVLVAGGRDTGGTAQANARLFDPAGNTWNPVASLSTPRETATATVLASGQVLVAGGRSGGASVASTERYDPVSRTWSPGPDLTTARHQHTATRLADGRVLVAGGERDGGVLATAELYDPTSNTWAPAAAASVARAEHSAVLLPDGQVLVVGGRDGSGAALASAELYDPATNTWTPAAALLQARTAFSLTLLPSGRVVAAGGFDGVADLASTEQYDAASDAWVTGGPLPQPRGQHTATLTASGQVLVAGGESAPGVAATTAVVLDPTTGAWTPVASPQARGTLAAVALPSGEVLLAGGVGPTRAELYDDTGASPAWRPVVTRPDTLFASCAITLEGQRFRGVSLGSGGNYESSPTDFPLVRLRSAEGGRLWTLPATDMSDTRATVVVPADTPLGPHALSVFSNAIPGGRMVNVVANTAPTAVAQSFDVRLGTPIAVTLEATDPDPGQVLTWTIVTPPRHGTLSGTPPDLTYTPDPGYTGPDSFTFQARDCGMDSNAASVDVTVEDDTTPPLPLELACPGEVVVDATGPDGAPATWPAATVTEGADRNPTLTYDPPQGSTFPVGTTQVTATAEDSTGQRAECQFAVRVRPMVTTVIELKGGGCQSTGDGLMSALALLFGLTSWRGLRRRRAA
ncbi:Ig-like domain-containing protein [Myxococcus sp. K15C18031901]|uniref:kelch repeat-containing protein n=1 Tax=Myxococcus dinghuensis TaxID=2906761 RepID=UPI0020A7FFCE|nr:kelch repeat-containing protein [Myxococcus dinghuensis]MCP3098016.1 Ig-like domain-containing protein [Myxococcus dinghuensis]